MLFLDANKTKTKQTYKPKQQQKVYMKLHGGFACFFIFSESERNILSTLAEVLSFCFVLVFLFVCLFVFCFCFSLCFRVYILGQIQSGVQGSAVCSHHVAVRALLRRRYFLLMSKWPLWKNQVDSRLCHLPSLICHCLCCCFLPLIVVHVKRMASIYYIIKEEEEVEKKKKC